MQMYNRGSRGSFNNSFNQDGNPEGVEVIKYYIFEILI